MKAASAIREDLAEIRARRGSKLPEQEVLKQAGVVTHFDLFALSSLHDDSDAAMSLLMDTAEPTATPEGAWSMPLSRRQIVLAQFDDRAAARECLAAMDERPENEMQKAFEALIEGPDAVSKMLTSEDPARLANLLEAYAWIADAPHLAAGLPDAKTIGAALVEARRVAPLRRLVVDHFQGREDILQRMQDYLDAPSGENVLFLHGPGGIGKSTVLAKFAMDAAERDDVDAIVYLNLDRPILRPEEPLTLLLDLLSQLESQFQHGEKILSTASRSVADIARELSYTTAGPSSLEAASVSGQWEWIVDDVAKAIASLPGHRNILVLIDTFEQVQRHGTTVVSQMWRMGQRLVEHVPRLRIIAAGRLEETQFAENRVALEAFERMDVERVLVKAIGMPVPEDLVNDIYRLTGGHPLTVQLAASLLGHVGLAAFEDPKRREKELSRLTEQRRDALLYGRILQQISDPQVQQIAIPGLVMRRITAEAIREVLAEPCGLELDVGEEYVLFDRMAAEVDLLELDYSDPLTTALVHRQDVRALMLADLRHDRKDQAAMIDDLAVHYFSQKTGIHARAEEIYHRIWRGDATSELDARWLPELSQILVSAIEELPADRQVWLADKLGVDPSPQAEETLKASEWEAATAKKARRLLTRGDGEAVLKLLSEREARLPGSELFAVEAEAHTLAGDIEACLATLGRGIESATNAGEGRRLAELLLLRSQTKEGRRQFSEASKDASRALEVSGSISDDEFYLRAAAVLLRLNRKSRTTAGPAADVLKEGVRKIIGHGSKGHTTARALPDILYANPALARELAAEIGAERPELLELSARQTASLVPPEADDTGVIFAKAVRIELENMEQGDFGNYVSALADRGAGDVRQNLPELIALARDRRMLDKVAKPLSWLLATEVDRRVGAFPSKSMIERTTGLKIEDV